MPSLTRHFTYEKLLTQLQGESYTRQDVITEYTFWPQIRFIACIPKDTDSALHQ